MISFTRPTASVLQRALACTASTLLEQERDAPRESALFGRGVHSFLERVYQQKRENYYTSNPVNPLREEIGVLETIDKSASYYDTCAAIDFGQVLHVSEKVLLIEPAFKVDFGQTRDDELSADLIGQSIGRKYPTLGPYELSGTADLIAIDQEGTGLIVDFKTGSAQHVEPVADNTQLKFLALAFLLYAKRVQMIGNTDRVRVRLTFINKAGRVFHNEATLSFDELMLFASQVNDVFEAAQKAIESETVPKPHRGQHCDFCPSFRNCPAQFELARVVASGNAMREFFEVPDALLASGFASMSQAEVVDVFDALRDYDRFSTRLWKALGEAARSRPIKLTDGRVYGYVETQREFVDVDAAVQLLDMNPTDVIIKRSISKSALIKAHGGAKEAEPVLQHLRKHGAIRSKPSKRLTVFTPGQAIVEEEE